MPDRCPKQHKLEQHLFEEPWHTKVPQVPILCEPGAPNSATHELVLIQASARTKASLVLMVCKQVPPEAQGSHTLGSHTTTSRRASMRLDVPASLGRCLVLLRYTISHTIGTGWAIARTDASTLCAEQSRGMLGYVKGAWLAQHWHR